MVLRRSDWKGAFANLLQHPEALGVVGRRDTGSGGHGLLHTCLTLECPNWFMDHIVHRTPVFICVGAQAIKAPQRWYGPFHTLRPTPLTHGRCGD